MVRLTLTIKKLLGVGGIVERLERHATSTSIVHVGAVRATFRTRNRPMLQEIRGLGRGKLTTRHASNGVCPYGLRITQELLSNSADLEGNFEAGKRDSNSRLRPWLVRARTSSAGPMTGLR
jgi:hypothetical protein